MKGCAIKRPHTCVARGGRVVKWKGQVASVAPSLFLASVSAAALSVGSVSAEILATATTEPVEFTLDEDNTITSTGSVDLTTGDRAVTIFFGNSTFTNNGVIIAPAPGESSGSGINQNGDLTATGRIQNNGVVRVSVDAPGPATAGGILMDGDVAGALINAGTISANAKSTFRAEAFGIGVEDSVQAGAVIENAGQISVLADADGGVNAAASGYLFGDDANAGLLNRGSILVTAQNSAQMIAAALRYNEALNGDITNLGSIQVNANNLNVPPIPVPPRPPGVPRVPDAAALYVEGSSTGNIVNGGSINVRADVNRTATAAGAFISDDLEGSFLNSGSLSVVANSPDDRARALGLFVGNDMTGDIGNSGSISVGSVGDTSAIAWGVHITNDLTGNFTNSGSITANANSPSGFADAAAVFVQDDIEGNLANSGTINVQSNGSTSVTAAGFYIGDNLVGSFLNSGSITVVGNSSDSQVDANGFYVDNDMTGDLINTGTVSVSVQGLTDASATGLLVSDDLEGNINNSGTIRAEASSTDDDGEAIGIRVGDRTVGNVTNSGSITAIARGGDSATASGIELADGLEGSLTNSGSISATATITAPDGDTAQAYGVYVGDDVTGNITNSGNINARAIGVTEGTVGGIYVSGTLKGDVTNSGTVTASVDNQTEDGDVSGIYIREGMAGSLVNSGTINATANNTEDEAEAYGIYLENQNIGDVPNGLSGNLSNTGRIVVRANGDSGSAYAGGIYVRHGFDGTLVNSGVIDAVSVSNQDDATARGIYIRGDTAGNVQNSGSISARAQGAGDLRVQAVLLYDDVTATVSNSGTISATANIVNGSDGAKGFAAGVWIEDMHGTFSNTGVINATATGGATADAFGLHFENFDGVITDVGQISASSDGGKAYAIYLGTGTGTLNVDSKDRVSGLIRVQDQNVNLDAQGGSAVFKFEDAAPNTGTFATRVSDGRSAWFVQDEGGAAPIYAVVDGSDVTTSGDIVAFYGSVVGGVGEALSYGQPAQVSRGFAFQEGTASSLNAFRPFAMLDAEYREFETTPNNDTDISLFNGSAGLSGQLENGLALAVGMGVFTADGDTSTTDFDTTGFYLDAALGRQIGAYTFEAGLGYGWLSTDRTRQIAGSTDAHADYDSALFTAHVSLERAFEIGGDVGLLGFGEARYTSQKDDGFTETGSAANATVGENTTEVIEARLGVEAEKTMNNGGVLKGQLSGVLRRGLGDTNTDVTVFSSTQTLTFASTDFTGASVALGYEKDLVQDMRLELKAEQEIGNDAQGPFLRAGLKWSF